MLYNAFHEEFIHNIQSKPPLEQPEAISVQTLCVHIHMFFFKEESGIQNVSKDLLSNFSEVCQIQILPKNDFFLIKSQLSDDFLYLHRGQKGRNNFCKIYNSYAT